MRPTNLLCLVGAVLLTGCAQFLHELANSGIQPQPARDYSTNPITLPQAPATVQPSFGNNGSDGYQTILVNTPNGLVYKRCKVLNGKATACF